MVPSIHQSIQQKSWLLKASRPSYLETRLSKLKCKNTFKIVEILPWRGKTSNKDHLGEQGQVELLGLLAWDEMGGKLWGGVCSIFQKHDPLVQQIPYAVTHLSKFLITLRWYSEFVATIVHRWNLMEPNESTTLLWNIFSIVGLKLCLTWACDINWMIISSHLCMW